MDWTRKLVGVRRDKPVTLVRGGTQKSMTEIDPGPRTQLAQSLLLNAQLAIYLQPSWTTTELDTRTRGKPAKNQVKTRPLSERTIICRGQFHDVINFLQLWRKPITLTTRNVRPKGSGGMLFWFFPVTQFTTGTEEFKHHFRRASPRLVGKRNKSNCPDDTFSPIKRKNN